MSITKNYGFKFFTLVFLTLLFVAMGQASTAKAQDPPPPTDNIYEEPWHPASRFAVKAGGKKEKATITLVKINNAAFTVRDAGLDFNICMEVKVKKARKRAVRRYALTNVFRNDETMAYTLKSWALSKTPPDFCKKGE